MWSLGWLVLTRSQVERVPACCRSVVIRLFISWRLERVPQDFINVVPAVPNKDLSLELVSNTVLEVGTLPGIFRVIYDLISKPVGTTE